MSVQSVPSACRMLPALTFQQPWATLLAFGAKRFETSRLPVSASMVGKHVVILAARNGSVSVREQSRERMARLLEGAGFSADTLPTGAAVGMARLDGCYQITMRDRLACSLGETVEGSPLCAQIELTEQEPLFGDYRPGRWLWQFSSPAMFLPGWVTGRLWRMIAGQYGFVILADGSKVFAHSTAIPRDVHVTEGETVRAKIALTARGLRALEVRPLDEGHGTQEVAA
jgi:activating signal cointegrator 1